MNMRLSTNDKFRRMFANILSIFVILAMALPPIGNAFAQEGDPGLRAFPDQDRVDGWFWPVGELVYLTINDVAFGSQTADDTGTVEFLLGGYDLKRGDTLTLSSGDISVTHIARQLFADNIDLDAQIVSGTVDGQQTVHVWIGDAQLYVEADQSGIWYADFSSFGGVLFPGVCGNAEAWEGPGSTIIDWCVPLPLWRDEIDGALADDWYWLDENVDKWNFHDGWLQIYASPYETEGRNILLRPVSQGDFAIETRVLFEPTANFQFAGLYISQDDGTYLALGRAFCDKPDVCVGNGIYFDYVSGGDWVGSNFATQFDNPFNSAESFLRLERQGDMVRAFYSHEGITWTEIGTHWIPPEFQVNGVGLIASGDYDKSDEDIPADFDYFELTEGWGFLPEGFHDYEGGDVPDWACNVGGWAADPDDRAADLTIEVNIDGTSLPDWLYASEYREDLDNAGVCADGNCSFSTSLWGMISSYEPHLVVTYAQDIPSGEWVQLSNSPKALTCRSYDIYAYDPLTGTTKLVTVNLPETGEYDPTWSQNGKLVAHDVVSGDSHGIYITDVKTGVSKPLLGAEDGGNDASWSPNGKWIAFDRRWYGEPNIFVVPATGGERMLVRENAVSANWAPNGKRIVFQDNNDGSIRTVAFDGGSGGETLVAEFGATPAWSPDGNWIAYSKDGDIWKVQVNVQGTVFGEPIQLTSNPFNDGKPTWSADSLTITYDSGFGQDSDLWSVPAAGGEATWLTGAPVFGEYAAANARNSSSVAYASFSPEGQSKRQWVAAYTYDPPAGTFDEGTHPYHFDFEWTTPEPGSWSGQGGDFVISDDAEIRDGYVLLRGPAEIHGINDPDGFFCEPVGEVNPSQPTRFVVGWVPGVDEAIEMTYPDAKAHFESITANAVWDDGSAELVRHEIIPLREDTWFDYVCTFTEAPPKMDLRVNYGHDWVESFYEAGHAISIQVTDSEGNVKATAEVFTGPRAEWGGESGFQTTPENWSPASPDLQPYDWVYAQVDNGATAKVQLGEIRGEVRFDLDSVAGTIVAPWITDPVQVECLDWGSGQETPFSNKDGGFRLTDGSDPYSCSWEGEWDVQPWQDIGVGYFTPDGHWVANAFRDERWMAFWTYDPPAQLFGEGEHSYYYEWAYTAPVSDSGTSGPRTMTIAGDPTPIYAGYALLGPWDYMPQQAWTGSACEVVEALHPNQPIRFVWGWVNDFSMTYEEALAHFASFAINVFWDGDTGGSAALATMSELIPFTGRDARLEHLCTLTEHP